MAHEFSFESIEREYERYWREFLATQLEDALEASFITEVPETKNESLWFREGLRFAIVLARYTESNDPIAIDIADRLRRRAAGEDPDARPRKER